jgi:hypothetical protein
MNLPFAVAVLPGYITQSQLSGLAPLPIFYAPNIPEYVCVNYGVPPSEYDFYPYSEHAVAINCSAVAYNGGFFSILSTAEEPVTSTLMLSGYYNSTNLTSNATPSNQIYVPLPGPNIGISSSPVVSFPPGAYTVVGGDEWGQLTVLHFLVTP